MQMRRASHTRVWVYFTRFDTHVNIHEHKEKKQCTRVTQAVACAAFRCAYMDTQCTPKYMICLRRYYYYYYYYKSAYFGRRRVYRSRDATTRRSYVLRDSRANKIIVRNIHKLARITVYIIIPVIVILLFHKKITQRHDVIVRYFRRRFDAPTISYVPPFSNALEFKEKGHFFFRLLLGQSLEREKIAEHDQKRNIYNFRDEIK